MLVSTIHGMRNKSAQKFPKDLLEVLPPDERGEFYIEFHEEIPLPLEER